jgi:hypothetical protein
VFRSADSLPSSEVLLPTTLPAGPRRCTTPPPAGSIPPLHSA